MPVADYNRRIRSGLFEIDLAKGRVFRDGREVPIQEQPFRVLEMLIEQPGERDPSALRRGIATY